MKTQSKTPWFDQNGKLLTDEKLIAISKDWDPETWENFLKSTVDSEISTSEVVHLKFEGLSEEQENTVWGSPCSLPEGVRKEIHSAVRKQKERPKKIIRQHYWENKSVREIAEIENLAPSRIHKIKTDSLFRIKGLLENSVNTSIYLIGGSEKSGPRSKSKGAQIREAYTQDLKGSYLK